MNLNFKQFINESFFSSFKYQFPSDKKQQMADFYALQMLLGRDSFDLKRQQLVADKGVDSYQFGKPRSMDDQPNKEDQVDYVLKEITNELLPQLKKEILEDVLFSIVTEARHAIDENQPIVILNFVDEQLGPEYKRIIRRFFADYTNRKDRMNLKNHFARRVKNDKEKIGGNENYVKAYHSYLNSKSTPEQFVEICEKMFEGLKWQSSYGGEAWKNICEAWKNLNQAKSIQSMFVQIDHIYDIQHNTGSVFNKLRDYASIGSELKDFQDKKANMNNPLEIYYEVSSSMRKILPFAAKFKFGTSLEDFENSKSNNLKKKKKVNSDIVKVEYDGSFKLDDIIVQKIFEKYHYILDRYIIGKDRITSLCYATFYFKNGLKTIPDEEFKQKILLPDPALADALSIFSSVSDLREELANHHSMVENYLNLLDNGILNSAPVSILKSNINDGSETEESPEEMADLVSSVDKNLKLGHFWLNEEFQKEFISISEKENQLKVVTFIRDVLGISLLYAKLFSIYFHRKFHLEEKCNCSKPQADYFETPEIKKAFELLNNPELKRHVSGEYLLPLAIYRTGLQWNKKFILNLGSFIQKAGWFSSSEDNVKAQIKQISNAINKLSSSDYTGFSWVPLSSEYNILLFILIPMIRLAKNEFNKKGTSNNLKINYILIPVIRKILGCGDTAAENILKLMHTFLHEKNTCNCGLEYK